MTRFACLLLMVAPGLAVTGTEPPTADRDFYERKVRPILVAHCYRCHSHQSGKHRGGLLLDSGPAIRTGGDSGPAVVAGQPAKSLLVRAVRHDNPMLQMPPTGKLPASEIAILEEWVRRGAPFPESGSHAQTKSGIDLEAGRRFWSFQPLRIVAPPPVRQRSWPRRRIDSFLLAALERSGLAPAPEAPRRVLIRRAYFDLIGLPPTPDEVEAFERDSAPDAYERLIERLLASPHYGERWARVWLDLARYADVVEPWAELKGQPWLYRDWVVRALNDDLPYDQFVQKQLAADQMPNAAPADRAALGFLGLSPVYWKELKLAPNVVRSVVAEEWEERIGAVSSTFLGLTVACARCHDHKFDPISQEDYYALAGVIASTRPAGKLLLSDDQAEVVRQAHARARPLQEQIAQQRKKKSPTPAEAKQLAELQAKVGAIRRATPHFDDPLAPAVEDAGLLVLPDGPHRTQLLYNPGAAVDVQVQKRGNPARLGPVVRRRFLAVLSPNGPKPFTHGSGRLELARAIVTDAAPLAARVIVNRIWKHHFGRGLVETPSDFGAQGARPSHPELLDDLAARFVAHGWSLKWLHREIVLSAAYRQVSGSDPDNRLLTRMNRRRLDVEAWRDAMLAVSGSLDLRVGGPSTDLGDANNHRRTLYGTVKRRELNDLLRLYDFPDPTATSAARVPTTTPLQQLFVLNSPFIRQQAAALAQRLKQEVPGNIEARVQRAYRLLYGRAATAEQVRLAVEFLTPANDELWREYCQVLLGSNEFLFVD